MAVQSDKQKLQNDQHQLIIQELLREEDNRYCVDCEAKGPRWASWNIGIFLCIRCAGIHRKLGVHISKVKSVTLDSWTPVQLASMRDMGNSLARAVYEARLPVGFRRPQNDAALEIFIRAKYDQKRYIDESYKPNPPNVESLMELMQRLEQAAKKKPPSCSVNIGHAQSPIRPRNTASKKVDNKAPAIDLLGIASESNQADLFSHQQPQLQQQQQGNAQAVAPVNTDSNQHVQEQSLLVFDDHGFNDIQPTGNAPSSSSNISDLLSLNLDNTVQSPVCQPTAVPKSAATADQQNKSTKESILALYAHNHNQAQLHHPNGTVGNVYSAAGGAWAVPPGNPVFSSASTFNQNMQAPRFPPNQFGGPNMFLQTGPETMKVNHPFQNVHGQPVQNSNMWNITCNSSQPTPFSSGIAFPAGVASMPSASNEAYLSQVNSQLASLQFGKAVNN